MNGTDEPMPHVTKPHTGEGLSFLSKGRRKHALVTLRSARLSIRYDVCLTGSTEKCPEAVQPAFSCVLLLAQELGSMIDRVIATGTYP